MLDRSALWIVIVAAGVSAAAPRSASASTLGLDFVPGPGDKKACSAGLFPGCVGGWSFTVTSTVQASALGAWDEDANGLVENHQVGLWSDSGTLLASALVTNASTAVGSTGPGQWLFTPISLVTLTPGTYVVGAAYSANDSGDPVRFNTITTTAPGLTFGHAFVLTNTAGLTLPTVLSPGLDAGLFGGNLQIVATPEPGTIALLAAGLGALAARRRRAGR